MVSNRAWLIEFPSFQKHKIHCLLPFLFPWKQSTGMVKSWPRKKQSECSDLPQDLDYLPIYYNGFYLFLCRAKNEDCQLIKSRPCHDFVYRNCFTGRELVDWLIQNGEVSDRGQGVILGRELLDQGIIKHGKKWMGSWQLRVRKVA